MKLAFLQDVYANPGPFTTVYLDTSGDAEDAAKAIELRWRSAKEHLAEHGADTATLQAIEDELGTHEWRTGKRGQVFVASRGSMVFHDELPQPPTEFSDDELAYVGAVPRLMPYLRMRAARIPHVIAVVDHVGGDVRVVDAARRSGETSVDPGGWPLRKSHAAGEGVEDLHHKAVEEQWTRNAAQVADEIDKETRRTGAEAVVLAGDVQQRKLVEDQMRKDTLSKTVETESSHRDKKASDEGLQEEVSEAIRWSVRSRTSQTLQEFERERGEHGRAAEGWKVTVGALQHGQVGTLLRHEVGGGEVGGGEVGGGAGMLYIGSAASAIATDEQTLETMGETDRVRVPADEAVVRALAGTGAELVLTEPDEVELAEGIGAVLRFTESP